MNAKRSSIVSGNPAHSWFGGRLVLKHLIVVLSLLSLNGCNESSQDLDERVTVLQKQLDQTEAQLEAANQSLKGARDELSRLKGERPAAETPPQTRAGSNLPSREVLEQSYTEQAKSFKQRLQQQLSNFTLGNCTVRNI